VFGVRDGDDSAVTTESRGWAVEFTVGADTLDGLGSELDELLDAVQAPICARRLWLTTWARAYPEFTPWTVTVRARGELTAVALLASRRRAGHQELVALGHGPSDYARLPARSDEAATVLAEALAGALRERRGPWRLRVDQLPRADPVATRLLDTLRHAAMEAGDPSPRLLLRTDRPPNEVMSSKTRQTLRTARNRLARLESGFSVRTDRSPNACDDLDDIEQVHRRRDHALGRPSDLDDPSRGRFWRALLAAYGARGEVEIGRLLIGSELAAYSIAFVDGTSYRLWDTRIDPAQSFVSPGRVLLAEIIDRLQAEGGWSEFDFMRGDEDYKRRMSDDAVPAEQLQAWSSGRLRRLEHGFHAARSRLRRR
jgi:CelD/BcsL family acetyltransferase involved in cellulose biosynthesis